MSELGEIKMGYTIGKGNLTHTNYNNYVWAACERCGKQRWVKLYKGEPHKKLCYHCGRSKPGAANPAWRGGRQQCGNGYIKVKLPQADFLYPMAMNTGYIQEHRLVMARHLDRCLLPWEVVHHKNGVRDDNRIENLKLLPTNNQHLPDSSARGYIKRLEGRVAVLEAELEALKLVKEFEKATASNTYG